MIEVVPAGPNDVGALAALTLDIDRFYGDEPTGSAADRHRDVHEALFGSPPAAHALLARDGDRLVGVATYSVLWPAVGVSRSLFLKELFVVAEYRHRGIGTLLVRQLCRLAVQQRCSRVEWTTETANADARRFYERLGAPAQSEKIVYRVEGARLSDLAADDARTVTGRPTSTSG